MGVSVPWPESPAPTPAWRIVCFLTRQSPVPPAGGVDSGHTGGTRAEASPETEHRTASFLQCRTETLPFRREGSRIGVGLRDIVLILKLAHLKQPK